METHIVSLGPCCITKSCINNMKFYSKTMPFDWMFSSLTFIKNAIADDFIELMDKNNIKSTNPCFSKNKSYNFLYNEIILNSQNITTHLLYKNEFADYNNFHMWNHYNLLEDEQYVKYVKYIERFKTMFYSKEFKIFVYIQYYSYDSCDDEETFDKETCDDNEYGKDVDDVIDFNNYINNTITNYKFICIRCKKTNEKATDNLHFSYYKDNLYIYDLEIEKWEDNIIQEDCEKIKVLINNIILESQKV
jgi:hypothetical protein